MHPFLYCLAMLSLVGSILAAAADKTVSIDDKRLVADAGNTYRLEGQRLKALESAERYTGVFLQAVGPLRVLDGPGFRFQAVEKGTGVVRLLARRHDVREGPDSSARVFVTNTLAEIEVEVRDARAWTHQVTLRSAGTRSECRIGRLTFAGASIPGLAGALVTPLGSFGWEDENPLERWKDFGWHRLAAPARYAESPVEFRYPPGGERWYRGPRLTHTPANWCWLAARGAWVDPAVLGEFLRREK